MSTILIYQKFLCEYICGIIVIIFFSFFLEIIRTLLTYITYNNENNQDELIINYNLLKIIIYESCTAYDKVFLPVTGEVHRRSSS